MTRLWQPPLRVHVHIEQGIPGFLLVDGQRYRVAYIALHWRRRIWWRGIWREYYKLIAQNGSRQMLIVIYKDLLSGDWYLQEIYD